MTKKKEKTKNSKNNNNKSNLGEYMKKSDIYCIDYRKE